MEQFRQLIRDIQDFPQKGVVFKDITPLLADPVAFRKSINLMSEPLRSRQIDGFVGIESRGFIFAAALSYDLGIPLIPVRKPGKLPSDTVQVMYELEYGSDVLEVHTDAIERGHRIVIVDDVLATGGTAKGTAQLVEKVGGVVDSFSFFIELGFLNGRKKLSGYDVGTVLHYT